MPGELGGFAVPGFDHILIREYGKIFGLEEVQVLPKQFVYYSRRDQQSAELAKPTTYIKLAKLLSTIAPTDSEEEFERLVREEAVGNGLCFEDYLRNSGDWSEEEIEELRAGLFETRFRSSVLDATRFFRFSNYSQLFTFRGGLKALLEGFLNSRYLQASNLLLNAKVISVENEKSRDKPVVTVRYQQSGTLVSDSFDRVIITVPLPKYEEIRFVPPLSSDKQHAIKTISSRFIYPYKMVMEFKESFWKRSLLSSDADTSIDAQHISVYSDLPYSRAWFPGSNCYDHERQNTDGAVILAIFACCDSAEYWRLKTDDAQVVEDVLAMFSKIFGEDVRRYYTGKFALRDWKEGGQGLPNFGPGELKLLFAFRTPHGDDRVYFAGEGTSVCYNSFMEGGVNSALAAVKQLVANVVF